MHKGASIVNEPFAIEGLEPPGWQRRPSNVRTVASGRQRLSPMPRVRIPRWQDEPRGLRELHRHTQPQVPSIVLSSTRSPAGASISASDIGELESAIKKCNNFLLINV